MARDKGEHQQALLGLRLMTAVQRQGLSVYALAKRAQLPVSTVQKICAGAGKQPSFWTLVALANALGLSLDTLAGHRGRCIGRSDPEKSEGEPPPKEGL